MMQEYELGNTETYQGSAETAKGPSEQIIQNIVSFARCYQNVTAGGIKIKLFLN